MVGGNVDGARTTRIKKKRKNQLFVYWFKNLVNHAIIEVRANEKPTRSTSGTALSASEAPNRCFQPFPDAKVQVLSTKLRCCSLVKGTTYLQRESEEIVMNSTAVYITLPYAQSTSERDDAMPDTSFRWSHDAACSAGGGSALAEVKKWEAERVTRNATGWVRSAVLLSPYRASLLPCPPFLLCSTCLSPFSSLFTFPFFYSLFSRSVPLSMPLYVPVGARFVRARPSPLFGCYCFGPKFHPVCL